MLPPVRPSAGVEAEYRRRLEALVEDMGRSVEYWLGVAYRRAEPSLAVDASPVAELQRQLRRVVRRWQSRFDAGAQELAAYFAQSAERRASAHLRRVLADAGVSVEFQTTQAMRDVMRATVQANVGLIKSIPQKYLGQVEGVVMRGVQAGRDAASVARDLQEQLGVARRRASLIARDQNNKATASLARVRMVEAGLEEAIWTHSAGGHEPRPSHVAAGQRRARYRISEGWYDPHEKRRVQPGELINCRCVGRPVVAGFS